MGMLKPYSTLAVGMVIGYFLLGKVLKMLPVSLPGGGA